MRVNQPVTQREIPFPEGEYIVSKTDLKGFITHVNDVFVRTSGFAREELIGQNHNIVRHPDMPPVAYAGLWETLKTGRPWTGIVKNRAKNGDHYWVEAVVAPIRENGQVVGYASVRSKPSREQVRAAEEIYPKLFKDNPKTSWLSRLPAMTISRKVAFMAALALGAIGVGTYTSLVALENVNAGNRAIVSDRLLPAQNLSRILNLMSENRGQSFAALQHDPEIKYSYIHDHPLKSHLDAIRGNIAVISDLFKEINPENLAPADQEEFKKFKAARLEYVKDGLLPVIEHLEAERYADGAVTAVTKLSPAYMKARASGDALMKSLHAQSEQHARDNEASFRDFRTMAIGVGLLSLLILTVVSVLIIRRLSQGLAESNRLFARMAEGILSDKIDLSRRDEIGDLLRNLCGTQIQMKVVLDEVKEASFAIDQRSKALSKEMNSIAAQSDDQSANAHALAAATEEFSRSVTEVADSARSVAEAAEETKTLLADSNSKINHGVSITGRVVDAVRTGASSVSSLDRAVRQIGEITETIKGIADQTNLLALNAAIEAARAGEQGRGFAVVADEVRKLAALTTDSTASISSKVGEFASIAAEAVQRMDSAVKEVEEGINVMRASVSGLDGIAVSSSAVDGMAKQIASATTQQAVAGEEIATSIERISAASSANASSVSLVSQTTRDLADAAMSLRAMVAKFEH